MKGFWQCFIFTIIIFSSGCCCSDIFHQRVYDPKALEKPYQEGINKKEIISLKAGNNLFALTPLATYEVTAKIVGKKKYSWGWKADVSPYDLALAWGELARPENEEYVKYFQLFRWYYYFYGKDCPFSKAYISSHSANTHIIPANFIVLKGLKRLRTKDCATFYGFLVRLDSNVNGYPVWWKSSLTRHDSGDGACELFYVTKIIYNGEIYQ
jgi:hypothetical protein